MLNEVKVFDSAVLKKGAFPVGEGEDVVVPGVASSGSADWLYLEFV